MKNTTLMIRLQRPIGWISAVRDTPFGMWLCARTFTFDMVVTQCACRHIGIQPMDTVNTIKN